MTFVLRKPLQFISGSYRTGSDGKVAKDIIQGVWEVDPADGQSVQFRIPSESIGTSFDRIGFYISSSGKVGVGTKDPQSAFDIRDVSEDTEITSSAAKTEFLSVGKNTDLIYLNPSDFIGESNSDYSRTRGGALESSYLTDGGDRLQYTAIKTIPNGYKATHVKLSGSSTAATYVTYSSSYDIGTSGTAGTSTAVNTEKDITDIVGGNGAYCAITVRLQGNLYGGYIKLSKS